MQVITNPYQMSQRNTDRQTQTIKQQEHDIFMDDRQSFSLSIMMHNANSLGDSKN